MLRKLLARFRKPAPAPVEPPPGHAITVMVPLARSLAVQLAYDWSAPVQLKLVGNASGDAELVFRAVNVRKYRDKEDRHS